MGRMRDFDLEVFFSRWEFAARHHMTASDAQSMTLSELLGMASDEDRTAFESVWLGYTETTGAPDLRAAIAQTYDHLSAEHIQCFAGAEEGIYAAMRVMLGAGDHAVVVVPNYQAAETVAMEQADVTGVPLCEAENWRLDIDAVKAAIRPTTKLVSVNFPNNPTGAIAAREDYDALIALCRQHGLYLFSDEVYRGLELDPHKRLPQAADAYEKGLSLNVMSKAYGLPGLRVGWIAGRDTEALHRFNRYKHYLSICNAAPSERLACIALKARDRIIERNRSIVRTNLEALDRFFAEFSSLFEWRHPDGGCVAFPRYTGPDGVEAFCQKLVEEAGVLLLPASIYRSELLPTPQDRFRIGCGRHNIEAGLAAMRNFCSHIAA
ncbi:MAG: aminotransferase class I/II-fold pyridoxal phosphate-dependent enzyme [Myxococcota bacterium]